MVKVCDSNSVRCTDLQDGIRGRISRDRGKAGGLRASLVLSVCGR